ncbi:MAG TPA: DinB family protein [Dehalococcoidia bacterium]|nr:DinB family protein [Dehalococcoidia bacterium]
MSKLEMVRGLYGYNEWANNHVLAAATRLTDEEFSRKQGASFESVEGNLAHIVGAQIIWFQRWTVGTNPKSIMETQSIRGLAAIQDMFAQSHDGLRQFITSLTEQRLAEALAYTDSRGNANERPMWQLMAHLANHGTHHRAETAMAMGAMVKPMRELDYVFFELERDRGGEAGAS